jgi:hypothetical protein
LLHLSARINFQLFHLVLTLAFIAAATFVCYRVIQVNPTTAGFAYLLCVLGVATGWGLVEAFVASVAAMLAFNFFFSRRWKHSPLPIFLIPAGLTYVFGWMVKDQRQGWALFAAMSVLFLVGAFVVYHFEQTGNPILTKLGLDHAGGNMEGKEVRFGASVVMVAKSAVAAMRVNVLRLNLALDQSYPLTK